MREEVSPRGTPTDHIEIEDHISNTREDSYGCKVERASDHSDYLVPAQSSHNNIYPRWYLTNAADKAALGFDIIGISLSSKAIGQIFSFTVAEHSQAGSKVEFRFIQFRPGRFFLR